MSLRKKNKLDPGTDISAIIWKCFQSTNIQGQLDSSHNLYKDNTTTTTTTTNNNNNNNTKRKFINSEDSSSSSTSCSSFLKVSSELTLDEILNNNNNNNDNNNTNNSNTTTITNKNNNNYECRIISIYRQLRKKLRDKTLLYQIIKSELIDKPLTPSIQTMQSYDFKYDVEYSFNNITSMIDIRRSKKWVKYVLSDKVVRYGTIEPHFIFNKIPGWLFDAAQHCGLSLIYSTDMRGVQEWMGQLCSLINLHNLIAATFEKEKDIDNDNDNDDDDDDINYTIIIMHLAGLLSRAPLNPINRQGMTFPGSILQSVMFENVKKRMISDPEGVDNLTNSISCALSCTNPPTGTKMFNLIVSDAADDGCC